jgi:hypothetical protein
LWAKKKRKTSQGKGTDWAEMGERGLGSGLSFFSNSFQTLKTSLKHKIMHSNYDAQALIVSKIIKMIFNV